jgi:hypothetical protein
MSYTWDNPDIDVIDTASGDSVGRHDLLQGRRYEIRAKISNHSFTVPALDTLILFKIKGFGINAGTVANLPPATVDVPNGGSAFASSHWTPEQAGHFCIKVIIVHSNDANNLNNVGQHNADVSTPGEGFAREIFVQNDRGHRMEFEMRANAYRLPDQPMRAKSVEERSSAKYLRSLQAANAPNGFPVAETAELSISPLNFVLEPGKNTVVQLKLGPRFSGQINIEAVSTTNVLLGGITIVQGDGS